VSALNETALDNEIIESLMLAPEKEKKLPRQ
jgi:hypothetical protein